MIHKQAKAEHEVGSHCGLMLHRVLWMLSGELGFGQAKG